MLCEIFIKKIKNIFKLIKIKLLLFLRTNESFAKFIVFRFSLRFICDPSIELPSYRTLLLVCEAPPIEPDLKIPGVVVDS